VQRLNAAREEAARRPGDLQPALDVAMHTAGLGRLRHAYELYGDAIFLGPVDPRPRLRRGELLLQLREVPFAIAELEVAERLVRSRTAAELEPQPDGSIRVSSIVFRIHFALGLARYLEGDFARARDRFASALTGANQAEEAATATLWHSLADREAPTVQASLALIPPQLRSSVEHTLEYRLLVEGPAPAGWGSGEPSPPANDPEALQWLVQGLAFLRQGQSEAARDLFRVLLRWPNWAHPAVLVAEKEVQRLSGDPLPPGRLGLSDGEQIGAPHQGLPQ
jgi:hypothetical protein